MKIFLKLISLFIVIISASNACMAFSSGKLEKIIEKSQLDDTSTIAISIRDVSNGRVVFSKNQDKLLHPASTLKVPTAFFAVNTLGYDYFFKTQFYTHDNNLYIKLGADPTLTTQQLKLAFQSIKEQNLSEFDNLYIDDSIIDKKEFSEGWMWDDDINPYTPKISAYNLDKNTIKINLTETNDGKIKVSSSSKYPMSVFAYIQKNKDINHYDISRYNWDNPELVEIYGTVSELKPIYIPISSMRRYFIFNVENIIEDERINIKETSYASKLVPNGAKKVYEISNPIKPTLSGILQESNNVMAETIYKLAGGSALTTTGTDSAGLIAMTDFYKKYNIAFDKIALRDGCGISRKNLVSADWMSDILTKIYVDKNFEKFKQHMAQPGDGTLSERLYDLRGDVWLKTGYLSNNSSISGYIKSKDGNTYAIAIYTTNYIQNPKDIKKFEDEIINIIYNR